MIPSKHSSNICPRCRGQITRNKVQRAFLDFEKESDCEKDPICLENHIKEI